ncbi:MAG: hypothetical protein IT242_10900, partial [Bacteroidia bacterium]|nr:hypothetical protein [Bacteroidia bacterium]
MQTLYPNYGRSAHARILPKAVLILLSLIAIKFSVSGQTCTGPMSGTYTVGSGSSCPDYATIAAVIADLNSRGVGGNVIVNIPAGYTETAPDTGFQLTFCTLPDSVKPNTNQTLTFQKNGAGTNPLITAPLWGVAGSNDAIFLFTSVDYLTIDGINLQENSSNTSIFTDYGFAFVKCDGTDGNNNNTIKNCTISLNTSNTASA